MQVPVAILIVTTLYSVESLSLMKEFIRGALSNQSLFLGIFISAAFEHSTVINAVILITIVGHETISLFVKYQDFQSFPIPDQKEYIWEYKESIARKKWAECSVTS